jgi:capsule polysaccharide export protein KpsE/RkpR
MESQNRFSILELMTIFYRYRKGMLSIIGGLTIIGLVVALVLPKWYYSEATIKPAGGTKTNIGSILGSDVLSGVGSLLPAFADFGLSGSANDIQLYGKILESRRVTTSVISHFNLMEVYDQKYLTDAIEELLGNIEIKINIESGTLRLGVFDKEPEHAKNMVEFLLAQLDTINIELGNIRAHNTREFLAESYRKTLATLNASEDSLTWFQKKYGIILITEQEKASIEAAARLHTEILFREVELNVARQELTAESPQIKKLQFEITSFRKKLNELYNSGTLESGVTAPNGIFIPFSKAPDLGLAYVRLFRNVKINEKLLEILLPMYEKAKLEEKQNTPTLLIVDRPYVPDKKSKPRRLIIVLIFLAGGIFLASMYVLYGEAKESLKTKSPETYAHIESILSYLRRKKKSLRN